MTTQFDTFCAQLSFRTGKKEIVKRELIRLHNHAMNNNEDVWEQLRSLDIPKNGTVDRVQGKAIMSSLREYMAKKQNYRCCYCQRHLYNIAYAKPIEHILPRRYFPRFSLTLANLAVACFDCNLKKKDDVWWGGLDPAGQYPEPHQLSNAFHCNHHHYNEHISWMSYATNDFAFSAYGGLTPEGKKLYRDLLHNISKTDILLSRNDNLKSALDTLKTMNENGEGGEAIRDFVQELQSVLLTTTEAD